MRYLVTYASKYGTARKYAQWIAEALCCDIQPAGKVEPTVLGSYDVLIHGGGLYAGGLSGIKTVTKHADALRGKTVIVFSCGLADPEDPKNAAHIESGIAGALLPQMREAVRQFHFRGGIDYRRLTPLHRAMMAMLRLSLLKKGHENLSAEDQQLLDTYGKAVDYSSRSSIAPLVDFVQQLS